MTAVEQNGSAVSAPVTPATTPTAASPPGIREGPDYSFVCRLIVRLFVIAGRGPVCTAGPQR